MKLTELYYAGSHGMDIMGPVRKSESIGHPNCINLTDKQVNRVFFFFFSFFLLLVGSNKHILFPFLAIYVCILVCNHFVMVVGQGSESLPACE